jgi:hypothetical protein
VRTGGEESVRVRRRGRRWPRPATRELGFQDGSGERRERDEKAKRRGGEWREPEQRLGFRVLRKGEPVRYICPPPTASGLGQWLIGRGGNGPAAIAG